MARALLRRGFGAWSRQLDMHPFRTQVVTSTVIAVTGDIACQLYFGRARPTPARRPLHSSGGVPAGASANDAGASTNGIANGSGSSNGNDCSSTLDLQRTARFGLYRCLHFCAMVPWFGLLERRVRFASQTATVVTKIAVDQLLWTPPSMAVFYTVMAMLEGGALQDGLSRSEAVLWPTLRVNWPFWTCVHALTFTVIPVRWRMVWISSIMVGWNAFLSHMNERGAEQAERADYAIAGRGSGCRSSGGGRGGGDAAAVARV